MPLLPNHRHDTAADPYPAGRVYVIKLHAAAHPATGVCRGRLEHVLTGHQRPFGSAAELLAALEGGAFDPVQPSNPSGDLK